MKIMIAMAGTAVLALAAGAAELKLGWLEAPTSSADSHEATAPAGSAKAARKVLYYRNPMGRPDTSPVPKKDEMGMDYIPVYAEEAPTAGPLVKVSLDRVQRSGVRTALVERRAFTHPVKATGIVKPDERTLRTVSLRTDGFIEKLYVNETGKSVREGEPLFRLYSPAIVSAQIDYRNQVGSESSRPREVGETYARVVAEQFRRLGVPETEIARLRDTGSVTDAFDVPAPASGIVLEKKIVEGQMAKTGEELYRIASPDMVWVIADVSEQDVGRIAPGAEATVTFRSLPGETFAGRVTFVMPEIDAATRTAKARIEIANPGRRLKYEMFADVAIASGDGAERIVVPPSAVLDSGTRQVVLVARGEGLFDPRSVTLGMRDKDLVEIRQGLEAGERVVVSANFLIDAEANLQAALKTFNAEAAQ